MVNKKYTILGVINLILAILIFILTFIFILPNSNRGVDRLFIFAILLIITGSYYTFIGIKNLKINNLIKYSATINIVALIIATIGISSLLNCSISYGGGFCILPGFLLIITSIGIFFIAFIIMVIEWSKSKRFK